MSLSTLSREDVVADCAPTIILLYHQINDLDGDPQRLAVTQKHFAEHLEIIRRIARPSPLVDLVEPSAGTSRDPRVIMTFDDGYADNLTNAKRLLEAADVSATVFVTSGQVGADREFWWDEVDRIILRSASLPEALRLRVGRYVVRWCWRRDGGGTASAFDRHPSWTIEDDDDPDPRHNLYRILCRALRHASADERTRALYALGGWAGTSEAVRPDRRAITLDELVRLSDGGLIEIGGHTVTHSLLAALPPDDLRHEITQCKTDLEEIIGRCVRNFSYPFGMRAAYDASAIEVVREAGFACACTNVEGMIRGGESLFELPRFLVRDWEGDEFAMRLQGWLAGAPAGGGRKFGQGIGSAAGHGV